MRRLPALALTTLALIPASALVATPAQAGNSTNVTFTLSGGSLTLTAPASAALSNSAVSVTGTSVTGTLGNTTVADTRGALAHTVTVNMSTTNFTDAANDTIAKANAGGYSGLATVTGIGVAVPTATDQTIGASGGATILTVTGVTGSASVSYNPTVDVTIPANAIAGDYTGTVTQTAS